MQKILKRVTVKKLITNIGHDQAGYQCDLYLDNKKIALINDDGYGGETEIKFYTSQAEEKLKSFLTEINYAEHLFKNGWEFMKSPSKIYFNSQIVALTENTINIKEEEKLQKKIAKATLKGFIYGTDNYYSAVTYKVTLADIVAKYPKGLELLQKRYDKLKTDLAKDEKVFNTNLEELGIKL